MTKDILTLQLIVLVKRGESDDHGHPVEDDPQQRDGDDGEENSQDSPGQEDPGKFHPCHEAKLIHDDHGVDHGHPVEDDGQQGDGKDNEDDGDGSDDDAANGEESAAADAGGDEDGDGDGAVEEVAEVEAEPEPEDLITPQIEALKQQIEDELAKEDEANFDLCAELQEKVDELEARL